MKQVWQKLILILIFILSTTHNILAAGAVSDPLGIFGVDGYHAHDTLCASPAYIGSSYSIIAEPSAKAVPPGVWAAFKAQLPLRVAIKNLATTVATYTGSAVTASTESTLTRGDILAARDAIRGTGNHTIADVLTAVSGISGGEVEADLH